MATARRGPATKRGPGGGSGAAGGGDSSSWRRWPTAATYRVTKDTLHFMVGEFADQYAYFYDLSSMHTPNPTGFMDQKTNNTIRDLLALLFQVFQANHYRGGIQSDPATKKPWTTMTMTPIRKAVNTDGRGGGGSKVLVGFLFLMWEKRSARWEPPRGDDNKNNPAQEQKKARDQRNRSPFPVWIHHALVEPRARMLGELGHPDTPATKPSVPLSEPDIKDWDPLTRHDALNRYVDGIQIYNHDDSDGVSHDVKISDYSLLNQTPSFSDARSLGNPQTVFSVEAAVRAMLRVTGPIEEDIGGGNVYNIPFRTLIDRFTYTGGELNDDFRRMLYEGDTWFVHVNMIHPRELRRYRFPDDSHVDYTSEEFNEVVLRFGGGGGDAASMQRATDVYVNTVMPTASLSSEYDKVMIALRERADLISLLPDAKAREEGIRDLYASFRSFWTTANRYGGPMTLWIGRHNQHITNAKTIDLIGSTRVTDTTLHPFFSYVNYMMDAAQTVFHLATAHRHFVLCLIAILDAARRGQSVNELRMSLLFEGPPGGGKTNLIEKARVMVPGEMVAVPTLKTAKAGVSEGDARVKIEFHDDASPEFVGGPSSTLKKTIWNMIEDRINGQLVNSSGEGVATLKSAMTRSVVETCTTDMDGGYRTVIDQKSVSYGTRIINLNIPSCNADSGVVDRCLRVPFYEGNKALDSVRADGDSPALIKQRHRVQNAFERMMCLTVNTNALMDCRLLPDVDTTIIDGMASALARSLFRQGFAGSNATLPRNREKLVYPARAATIAAAIQVVFGDLGLGLDPTLPFNHLHLRMLRPYLYVPWAISLFVSELPNVYVEDIVIMVLNAIRKMFAPTLASIEQAKRNQQNGNVASAADQKQLVAQVAQSTSVIESLLRGTKTLIASTGVEEGEYLKLLVFKPPKAEQTEHGDRTYIHSLFYTLREHINPKVPDQHVVNAIVDLTRPVGEPKFCPIGFRGQYIYVHKEYLLGMTTESPIYSTLQRLYCGTPAKSYLRYAVDEDNKGDKKYDKLRKGIVGDNALDGISYMQYCCQRDAPVNGELADYDPEKKKKAGDDGDAEEEEDGPTRAAMERAARQADEWRRNELAGNRNGNHEEDSKLNFNGNDDSLAAAIDKRMTITNTNSVTSYITNPRWETEERRDRLLLSGQIDRETYESMHGHDEKMDTKQTTDFSRAYELAKKCCPDAKRLSTFYSLPGNTNRLILAHHAFATAGHKMSEMLYRAFRCPTDFGINSTDIQYTSHAFTRSILDVIKTFTIRCVAYETYGAMPTGVSQTFIERHLKELGCEPRRVGLDASNSFQSFCQQLGVYARNAMEFVKDCRNESSKDTLNSRLVAMNKIHQILYGMAVYWFKFHVSGVPVELDWHAVWVQDMSVNPNAYYVEYQSEANEYVRTELGQAGPVPPPQRPVIAAPVAAAAVPAQQPQRRAIWAGIVEIQRDKAAAAYDRRSKMQEPVVPQSPPSPQDSPIASSPVAAAEPAAAAAAAPMPMRQRPPAAAAAAAVRMQDDGDVVVTLSLPPTHPPADQMNSVAAAATSDVDVLAQLMSDSTDPIDSTVQQQQQQRSPTPPPPPLPPSQRQPAAAAAAAVADAGSDAGVVVSQSEAQTQVVVSTQGEDPVMEEVPSQVPVQVVTTATVHASAAAAATVVDAPLPPPPPPPPQRSSSLIDSMWASFKPPPPGARSVSIVKPKRKTPPPTEAKSTEPPKKKKKKSKPKEGFIEDAASESDDCEGSGDESDGDVKLASDEELDSHGYARKKRIVGAAAAAAAASADATVPDSDDDKPDARTLHSHLEVDEFEEEMREAMQMERILTRRSRLQPEENARPPSAAAFDESQSDSATTASPVKLKRLKRTDST